MSFKTNGKRKGRLLERKKTTKRKRKKTTKMRRNKRNEPSQGKNTMPFWPESTRGTNRRNSKKKKP